jgi:transcriptional regulator with XRE-family HTH domain
LREARIAAGLTQRQIGEIVGLSPSAITMIERGDRDTGVSTVEQWASACGMNLCLNGVQDDRIAVDGLTTEQKRIVGDLVALLPTLPDAHLASLTALMSAWRRV